VDYSNILEKTFKSESFPEDKPLNLTIDDVVAQEVGIDKDTKPVAYFKEDPRGLVLNKTNYGILTKAHANPNTDAWIGAVIQVWKDPTVTFSGKTVGGLKVKIITKAVKK